MKKAQMEMSTIIYVILAIIILLLIIGLVIGISGAGDNILGQFENILK